MLVLARALAAEPKILLVDELSQGLAPIVVERLFRPYALRGVPVITAWAVMVVAALQVGFRTGGGVASRPGAVTAGVGKHGKP